MDKAALFGGLMLGFVAFVILLFVIGMAFWAVLFKVAFHLIGVGVTWPQAFGLGLLASAITSALRVGQEVRAK